MKEKGEGKRTSTLLKLSPCVGEEGLLRVDSRNRRIQLPNENLHPVILPAKHQLITQLIRAFPNKHNHCGTEVPNQVASEVIAQNEHRLGKTLRAAQAETGGEKVRVQGLWDDKEEARFIGTEIEDLVPKGHSLTRIAILVRVGFQTREFEERLIPLGIPYRIVSAVRFYERLEIKDALTYLRAVAHPDDSLAFERLLNTPKRGLGPSVVQALHQTKGAFRFSVSGRRNLGPNKSVKGNSPYHASRGGSGSFEVGFQQLSSRPLGEVVAMILDESGYTGF